MDERGIMDEYCSAFYFGMIDHVLAIKPSFITVHRFWMEFDFSILCQQFRVAIKENVIMQLN